MILFENPSSSAAFWFAAEEYVMKVLKPGEPALMLWSTDDTVMIGANQISGAECDIAYAQSAGIEIVRRPSGGGAIFTDRGVLQLTVILPYRSKQESAGSVPSIDQNEIGDPFVQSERIPDHKAVARDWLSAPLIKALASYGICASLEGRNDVVIGGKKISGIAQHIQEGYICSHCSILFSADLDRLEKVLTVDREKIKTKAIASVRSRVANISEHISEKDLGSFREYLIESCTLSPETKGGGRSDSCVLGFEQKSTLLRRSFFIDELEAIDEIMRAKYVNPFWTYGREPAFTFTNKKRFPGGQLEVFLNVKGGIIQDARINGDFLALRPIKELEDALAGVPHRKEPLAEAIKKTNAAAILGSLGADELLEVLF